MILYVIEYNFKGQSNVSAVCFSKTPFSWVMENYKIFNTYLIKYDVGNLPTTEGMTEFLRSLK